MNAYQYEIETIFAVFNGGLTPNACDVISALEPEMFSNDFNAKAWSRIKTLYAAGEEGTMLHPVAIQSLSSFTSFHINLHLSKSQ